MGLRVEPNLGSAVSVAIANGFNANDKRYIEAEEIFLPGAYLPANISPRLYKQFVSGDPHLNRIFVEEDNGIEHSMPEDSEQLTAITSNPQAVPPTAPYETVQSEVPTQASMSQQVPVSLEQVQQQTAQVPVQENQQNQQPNDDPYPDDEWTKDALVEELKKRDLPSSGNKDELIARLVEDDNTRAQNTAENPFAQS